MIASPQGRKLHTSVNDNQSKSTDSQTAGQSYRDTAGHLGKCLVKGLSVGSIILALAVVPLYAIGSLIAPGPLGRNGFRKTGQEIGKLFSQSYSCLNDKDSWKCAVRIPVNLLLLMDLGLAALIDYAKNSLEKSRLPD